jgi:hypothetical protein
MEEIKNHKVRDNESVLMFPELIRGDSLFRSIEAQLPMLPGNSIFSNFATEELSQNSGLVLSRQPSLTIKPLILYQEERLSNDKRESREERKT